MATFITSKPVEETLSIGVFTSTEYWKYNHDGSDSSVYPNGYHQITVQNANGEFTIIPCLSDGTVSGNITTLNLGDPDINNSITSFNGTGLTSLTQLNLLNNLLTSFDGTGLSSLTYLVLHSNQLTSFDPTGLSSLNSLNLNSNLLTSFDGTGLTSLTTLDLQNNPLTTFIGGDMGQIYSLDLSNLQLSSFDGTGLTSLTELYLNNNQLTSFNGTGLSSLTYLYLNSNQLTSFDGTGLSSLTNLDLDSNQLTSFDGIGLSGLTYLALNNNQLSSFDGTGLSSLTTLYLDGNQFAPSSNNQILNLLDQYGLENGTFETTGGRTSDGTSDYNALIARGWNLSGVDLLLPVTFITSKPVGDAFNIGVDTSTGYWKYNHDGSDSAQFENGGQTITVSNANGEFTIIPCLSDGTVSGDITDLNLSNNQITSFDGTGLPSLNSLGLINNLLTSLEGFILPTSLTGLYLNGNLLTSFDGTGLTSLTNLILNNNLLTSFDGTGLSSLNSLSLESNPLTSFNGTDLTSLTGLYLFDGKGLSSSITPGLNNSILNQLNNNGVTNGLFRTANGRTSAGTADYDSLIGKGWNLQGLELVTPPPSGNGKLRIKGVTSGGGTTTTTTTEPVFYTYDFSSLTFFHGEFSNQFGKAGVTNWDGTYRIVATNLNIGTLVYYIGTDGNKHLFTFDIPVIEDFSNFININQTGIYDKTGTVTFDSVTPFVVTTTTTTEAPTTTTTTTEAPTTTTTTTIPSLYWDSIELGSVDEEGNPLLNIDFTEYGFDDLTSFSRRTAMVIPATGSSALNTRVGINGVPHVIVQVSYFDNTNDSLEGTIDINVPSQDPTIGTINKPRLAYFIEAGNVMTTDQVKLAVIQAGSAKGSTNMYITDSLSSTIGTVQDILDIVPATTTTTTVDPSSYMFSIPEPAPNTTPLANFSNHNITTTTGYFKYEQNGIISGLHTGYGNVGGNANRYMINLGYGNFTIISCDVNGNPSGTITQMSLNGMNIDSFNGTHSGLSGLTRLSIVNNSITSLDVSSMINLDTLFITNPYGGDSVDSMTPQSNTDILLQLNANGLQNGTFTTNGGRVTSQASEAAYLGLINKGWTLLGLTAV